jgi:esterase/lipase superfamily enzyme
MNRQYHKWFSPALGREMELLRFGHAGLPLLIFPTSMGRFFENEDRGMLDAVAHRLDNGTLQAFCVDSVDTESWYNKQASPNNRVWRHSQYEHYLLTEVLPMMRHHGNTGQVAVMGASFGGYHAVNLALRHPHLFSRCISLSGAFDISGFLHGGFDENAYFHNPPSYLPNLTDHNTLEAIRSIRIILGTSNWDICRKDNEHLSSLLHNKGIPHWLDVWGDGYPHDWPLWLAMMRKYF